MPISGKEAVKALERNNFTVVNQRGPQVTLYMQAAGDRRMTPAPLHKELKKGILHGIAKLARIDIKEFGL